MRLFIASGFSAPVTGRVRELQAWAAPRLGSAVKWVEPENLHLTYVFLGEVSEAMGPAVLRAAGRAAGQFKKMEVRLGGLGAFPSFERPRVLWLGLAEERPGALKELALGLSEALAAEGFMYELKFEPHLTIARVKARPDPAILEKLRRKASGVEERSLIASVDVVQSLLSSAGPRYKILASTPLP